jgi:hypothetical protein
MTTTAAASIARANRPLRSLTSSITTWAAVSTKRLAISKPVAKLTAPRPRYATWSLHTQRFGRASISRNGLRVIVVDQAGSGLVVRALPNSRFVQANDTRHDSGFHASRIFERNPDIGLRGRIVPAARRLRNGLGIQRIVAITFVRKA